MKVVILADGYSTRISEESVFKPKPIVEICRKPVFWHIMKNYAFHGLDKFTHFHRWFQKRLETY